MASGNKKNPGSRHRIILAIVLCIIVLLMGTGFTGIPGLDILFIPASLISVVLAGIWFGRYGFAVAVLLAAGITMTTYSISGSVSSPVWITCGLLLVVGFTSAILSERVRIQKAQGNSADRWQSGCIRPWQR